MFFFTNHRKYDEDFEDEDDGVGGPYIEPSTTKRIGFGSGSINAVSPPQRLGLGKINDLDEQRKD